ncbi:MAG TPA: hypothetical protein VJB58_01045 [Candidatus Paceibacterota bacterium]
MDFEKISEAIKKSSNQVKNLLFSDRLGGLVQDIAWDNALSEETALKLGDEVSYVILSLKPKEGFKNSLLQMGIKSENVEKIASEVNIKIFSQINMGGNNQKYPENIETQTKKEDGSKKPELSRKDLSSNSIGQSFEDLILNQARGMQPAKESGQQTVSSSQAPDNLPIENNAQQNKPEIKVPNYSGSDPYREPLEN